MLRTDKAAKYLAVSKSTLEKLRLTGDGPEYIKLGRTVVYKLEDLDKWVDANRRKSTSVDAQPDPEMAMTMARLIAEKSNLRDPRQWIAVRDAAHLVITQVLMQGDAKS